MANHCQACGAELDSEAAFCTECGTPADRSELRDRETPAPVPEARSRRRGPSVAVLLGLLVVLFLGAAAGGGAWWFLFRGKGGCQDLENLRTNGFPVEFDASLQARFPHPAQLAYQHFMDRLYESNAGNISVGSPTMGTVEVEIAVKIGGESHTFSFIEFQNTGSCARVMVGPADSEPFDIYVLERRKGGWVLIGTEPVVFPDPGEMP